MLTRLQVARRLGKSIVGGRGADYIYGTGNLIAYGGTEDDAIMALNADSVPPRGNVRRLPRVGWHNETRRPDGGRQPTCIQCSRRDLNPHGLPRRNLNPVRLPIPPLELLHC